MNSDRSANAPAEPPDEGRVRRLAAYDDALAGGGPPAPVPGEDLDLLHLLDGLRPSRRVGEVGGDPAPSAADEAARYVLRGLRAVGGVGEIWLARDVDLDRDVALKVLRPDRAADPAF